MRLAYPSNQEHSKHALNIHQWESYRNPEPSRAPHLLDQSRPIHCNQPQARAIKSNQECLACSINPDQSIAINLQQEQSRAIKSNQECLTCSSLGSLVIGLLHRSIVFAAACEALPHQDSHQSHSSGKEWMGT